MSAGTSAGTSRCPNTRADSNLFSHVKCKYPEPLDLVKQCTDVFTGVGRIPGEVSLKIDPDAIPVAHPPRPVPEPLRGAIQEKLAQLERDGIIVKIPPGTSTPWCAPMHTVLKKSKMRDTGPITVDEIRMTIDPRDLNKALLREYHPINTVEQVITKAHGSKVFTKLDAGQGFFQLVLDEPSSMLTAFNTPFGRYEHKRLPMGISVAPEIYQRAMQEIFGDIDGCEVIFDDLLLHARSVAIHQDILRQVLQRARENNVVFNVSKLYLCGPRVEYVGHILSDEGVKVSPEKVSAVINMPRPQSVAEVQTLLGMVTYTCKFLRNLSTMTEPLRQLVKESNQAGTGFKFHWDPCHETALNEVKRAMTSAPVRGYYTLDQPITMGTDASQSGLGAVLYQNGKPIYYASKALTKSEYLYAQIEKELLAIVWGFQKFHTYLYGRADITVETDHRPLVNLREKSLFEMTPRLQKMFLRLRPYTFDLVHKPGKSIPAPDCMSRLYMAGPQSDEVTDVFAVTTDSFSSRRLLQVQEETKKDPALQKLISVLRSPTWPDRSELDP